MASFRGAKSAPILFSDLGFCMDSCSCVVYIYGSLEAERDEVDEGPKAKHTRDGMGGG